MAPLQALPLLIYAAALAAGCVAHTRLPSAAAAAVILVAFGCSLAGWHRNGGDIVRFVLVIVAAFVTGFLLSSFGARHLQQRDNALAAVIGKKRAHIIVAVRRADSDRLRLSADVVVMPSADGRLVRTEGRVRVLLATPAPDGVAAGCVAVLSGSLRSRPARSNPADFDYAFYLRRRSTSGIMRATAGRIACPRLSIVSSPLTLTREWARAAISSRVGSDGTRSVVSALVLGDRSALDDDTRRSFSRSGLAHVLAVSGLHVLIVGMSLNRLLRLILTLLRIRFLAAYGLAAVATLFVVAIYVGITGAAASSVRAAVMTAGLLWQGFSQRPAVSLNSLGAAAVVLTVRNPLEVFDPGFQLSFGAVAGLVLLGPSLTHGAPARWQRVPGMRFAIQSVAASLAATAGTLPFLVYHFGRVPLAGVILNIAAIPLTVIALASGVGIVSIPSAAVLAILSPTASGSSSALLFLARWGEDALGWLSLHIAPTTALHMAAIVLIAAAVVAWQSEGVRFRLAALAMTCASLGNALVLTRSSLPELEVVVFAVGHGDAVAVRTPNERWLLVDTGDSNAGFEPAARSILPFLRRRGARSLEALVLTHADRDHTGGAPGILRSLPVKRLVASAPALASQALANIASIADSTGTKLQPAAAGDMIYIDSAIRIYVLSPPAAQKGSDNDRSIVLLIRFGRTSFLLTGDVERAAEFALARTWGRFLASCMAKVPHHGSQTSSTVPLVRNATIASKTVAVVSAGGRYGLPSPKVRASWTREGALVLETSSDGAITVRSNGTDCRARSQL